jgi:hypothetical protein
VGKKGLGSLCRSIELQPPSQKDKCHSTPFHSGELHCCFGSLFVQKYAFEKTLGE